MGGEHGGEVAGEADGADIAARRQRGRMAGEEERRAVLVERQRVEVEEIDAANRAGDAAEQPVDGGVIRLAAPVGRDDRHADIGMLAPERTGDPERPDSLDAERPDHDEAAIVVERHDRGTDRLRGCRGFEPGGDPVERLVDADALGFREASPLRLECRDVGMDRDIQPVEAIGGRRGAAEVGDGRGLGPRHLPNFPKTCASSGGNRQRDVNMIVM